MGAQPVTELKLVAVSTKLSSADVRRLHVLALKLRSTPSAIIRAWVEAGLEANRITPEDEARLDERRGSIGVPGLKWWPR